MLDPQDESFDRRLATHLVSLYYRTGARVRAESIVSNGTSVFYFLVSVFSRSLVKIATSVLDSSFLMLTCYVHC